MHHPQRLRTCGAAAAPLIAALMGAFAFACSDGQEPAQEQSAAPGTAAVVDSAPAPVSPEPVAATSPEEIYYDLTAHAWYRQGRPLQHAGAAYQARARPLRARADSLEAAGRFEEVDYYRRLGAAEERPDTLFVPVYPGYWQPFLRGGGSGGG